MKDNKGATEDTAIVRFDIIKGLILPIEFVDVNYIHLVIHLVSFEYFIVKVAVVACTG